MMESTLSNNNSVNEKSLQDYLNSVGLELPSVDKVSVKWAKDICDIFIEEVNGVNKDLKIVSTVSNPELDTFSGTLNVSEYRMGDEYVTMELEFVPGVIYMKRYTQNGEKGLKIYTTLFHIDFDKVADVKGVILNYIKWYLGMVAVLSINNSFNDLG